MRRICADVLLTEMQNNKDIFILMGDLGYKMWDVHIVSFPDRVINCGASEQMMMDVAVGLAQSGKIPFVYSITPFLIYRPFEAIKLYLSEERANVKLLASGRDKDYKIDGPSHDGTGVENYLELLKIPAYFPKTKEEIPNIIKQMVRKTGPEFLSLRR